MQQITRFRKPSAVPIGQHRILTAMLMTLSTLLLLLSAANAAQASNERPMLRGYDPVSYFSKTGPQRGKDEWTEAHNGETYKFSSVQNADKFRANPDKFVPQFGGNCALGMVFGNKSSVDPKVWKIVDGKLYFHINAGTQRAWWKKRTHYIKRAEVAWSKLRKDSPANQ